MPATELECLRETVSHRRPPRMLYEAAFTPDLHRRVVEHIGTEDIVGHYGFWRPFNISPKPGPPTEPIDYKPYWEGETLPAGATIGYCGVVSVPGTFYHFTKMLSPLRNASSLKDIEDFPLPDNSTADWSHCAAEVAAAQAKGLSTHVFVGHMYELAWQIRGYEQFLMDTIEHPAWADCLLQRLADGNMRTAVGAAEAGVDYIYCGDDVANQNALMFNKPTWWNLIGSKWAKIWQAIKEIHPQSTIGYHTDGNAMDIVEEMIDSGLDFLNPVQPECMDESALKARLGKRIGFHGCIGTQSTMPWGTPAGVRARVKECIDSYGANGGLILAPTHVLEPEVPLENIDAFVDACRQYGTFE